MKEGWDWRTGATAQWPVGKRGTIGTCRVRASAVHLPAGDNGELDNTAFQFCPAAAWGKLSSCTGTGTAFCRLRKTMLHLLAFAFGKVVFIIFIA